MGKTEKLKKRRSNLRYGRTYAAGLFCFFLAGCASETAVRQPISSYACQPKMVDGQETVGQGDYGCYFVLRHPTTKKVLANTPYQLRVKKPTKPGETEEDTISTTGITDDGGRSAFVRTPFPQQPESTIFVEAIGQGTYRSSFHLVDPRDGHSLPNQPYRIYGCATQYAGHTDEQGHTVMLLAKSPCKVKVEFLDNKRDLEQ